jgi:hypothetical protein
VFGDNKVGARRASRLISVCCRAVKPVLTITIRVDFFAAARKKPKDASGLVKSMMTALGLRTGLRSSVTGTARLPVAEISPASFFPDRALPRLSMAATSQ